VKDIEILHEDDFSLIINKPAGLAVQGGAGIKTSLDRLLAEIRTPAPLLVHRLDKDTSGALLTAKGRESANRFSQIISSKKAVKLYTAVCTSPKDRKFFLQDSGLFTDELLIHGNMKKSQTKYKIIKNGYLAANNLEYSILELELETGRMHQIRRHLAMNGIPILGDDKYGDFSLNKKLRKEAGLKRMLLHASRLIIKNEFNIDVTAPLPDYFASLIS
jgi:23S rRNA pseudouridine955/2504/2580 synthase